MVPYSLLDLSSIAEGGSVAQSLRETMDLARHAEQWGYRRYWLAEHHNLPSSASAASSIVISHVAAGTSRIRVGAGGIMLPNHAPLVIAEQFGTLESLFPTRIDLGLGRWTGANEVTTKALRSNFSADSQLFSRDVSELMGYFSPPAADQPIIAVPGAGLSVPLWILGSGPSGARFAAMRGLPFAFASHFAPAMVVQSAELYRAEFRPSAQLSHPYMMFAVNVVAAETDSQANILATSLQQAFINQRRGIRAQLPTPMEGYMESLPSEDRKLLTEALSCSAIGSPNTVRSSLASFIERMQPDELMLTAQIFDHRARLNSYEIAAEQLNQLSSQAHLAA
jgi:luciferase family oxidoreductase group 1